MKILVISLPGSTQRRKSIQVQFSKLGLEFEFVDGVLGKALSQEEIRQVCEPQSLANAPRWLSKGVIGCALAHRKAYQIIARDHACALVLQDDAILPLDLASLLDDLAHSIYHDEIILLYYTGFHPIRVSRSKERELTPPYDLALPIDRENIPGSALGFVISQAAAQSLYENTMPIRVSTDSWGYFLDMGIIGELSVVFPQPLYCGAFKSEIDYLGAYYSPLVSFAAKMIDNYKIPLIYGTLARRRMRTVANMTRVELVEQKPEFARRDRE